jgi:tetratricopeptide (TPR) repeat protein
MKDQKDQDALERQEEANRAVIAALGQLSRDVQAPPNFVARVLAKAEQRPAPRPGLLAWLRHEWSPTWATALAMGLLLSVGVNTWLGYKVLEQRQPFQTPSRPSGGTRQERPPETSPLTFRGGEPPGPHQVKYLNTRELEEGRAEAVLVEELRRLAVVHYEAKRYPQAITAATAALVLDANAAALYFYRGMAYEAIGDRRQAIQDLQHAARRADVVGRARDYQGLGAEAQRVLRTWGVEW